MNNGVARQCHVRFWRQIGDKCNITATATGIIQKAKIAISEGMNYTPKQKTIMKEIFYGCQH